MRDNCLLNRGERQVFDHQTLKTIVGSLREAIFLKKQSKYGHSPEGGGGFNPCPNVLEHFFLGALYLGKMPKGGGVKLLPKDLEHF